MRASSIVAILLIASTALAADVGEIALVEDTDGSINQSVAMDTTYLSKISCAFYKTHPENFDVLFAFTTYPITMFGTPAGWAVRRTAKGIGYDVWTDQSSKYCSKTGRLKHAMKMGDLAKWAEDPDTPYTSAVNGVFDGIEVMGHEIGHLWLVGADYQTTDGARHCRLRALSSGAGGGGTCDGYNVSDFSQHYSYFFDGRSPMFASFIDDLGGGKFKIYHEHPKYGLLDQYMMGLRDRSEVPPMLVVDTGSLTDSIKTPLPIGQSETVTGTRIDVTIDDIIRALGSRTPPRDPCHLKAAFIIVYPKGQVPSAQVVAKVDGYRKRWETWYDWATDNRGSFDTTLSGTGAGTPTCPAPNAPDGGFPDSGPADAGVETDTGPAGDAGFVACGAGVTSAEIAMRPCEHSGDTCNAADSTCGGGGYVPCHCMNNLWQCPAVDCIDAGAGDAAIDAGPPIPCGQYTSVVGYQGRPCETEDEVCEVATNVCGPGTETPCTCRYHAWICPAVDCVDGGVVVRDGGGPGDDTGTAGGEDTGAASDTGSKAGSSSVASGGSEGGCSCAVIDLR